MKDNQEPVKGSALEVYIIAKNRLSIVPHCSVWSFLAFVMSVLLTLSVCATQSSAEVIHTFHKQSVVTVKESVTVPVGDKVENVAVFGGDATIAGTVSDTVFVIRGNVHLASSARVGMVIELGGQLIQAPGSHATAIYKVAFNQPIWDSVAVGSLMVIGVWSLRLGVSALIIVVPVILYALFRRFLSTPIQMLDHSRRRTGFIGFLTTVCIVTVSTLLAVTLIGLPVTAFLMAASGIIGWIGMSCVATKLGEWTRLVPAAEALTWRHTMIGAVLITAFSNIPLVGPLFLFVSWCLGIGLMTAWFYQRRIRRN